jgi:hypothetical protein
VLFDIDTVNEGSGDWHRDFEEILRRHVDRRPPWRSPDFADHVAFLIDSSFSRVEGVSVMERRRFPADQMVHRAFSLSGTSPDALGPDKAAALATDLRALADRVAVDGMVDEILQSNATMARRS